MLVIASAHGGSVAIVGVVGAVGQSGAVRGLRLAPFTAKKGIPPPPPPPCKSPACMHSPSNMQQQVRHTQQGPMPDSDSSDS